MPSDLFQPGALAKRSIPASTRPAGRGGKGWAPLYGSPKQLKTVGNFYHRFILKFLYVPFATLIQPPGHARQPKAAEDCRLPQVYFEVPYLPFSTIVNPPAPMHGSSKQLPTVGTSSAGLQSLLKRQFDPASWLQPWESCRPSACCLKSINGTVLGCVWQGNLRLGSGCLKHQENTLASGHRTVWLEAIEGLPLHVLQTCTSTSTTATPGIHLLHFLKIIK